jgi:hypothetical protein
VRVSGTHRIHVVCVTEAGGGHRVDGAQQRRHQRDREPSHGVPWTAPAQVRGVWHGEVGVNAMDPVGGAGVSLDTAVRCPPELTRFSAQ